MRGNPPLILGVGSPYQYKTRWDIEVNGREFITIPARDLMHIHVIGKSRYGKSYWLAALFVMLLSRGIAATLIDPAGDTSRLVLKMMIATGYFDKYPDAFSRLVYLNFPDATERGLYVPFNVLNCGYDPYTTSSLVLEAIKRLWPSLAGGTSTNIETLVKIGSFVLAVNKLSLLPYISYLFANPKFRGKLLSTISDADILSSFAEYGFTRGGQVSESIKPTLKRIKMLSFAPALRYSLGQKENALDFRKLLDGNRSVIINLNFADQDALRLIGCLYTVYAEIGAKKRGQERGTSHVLMLDEFQNFVAQSGGTFGKIFEECGKYKLFLCLSHQHWGQVPPELRGSLNQCELALAFHLERKDAEISQQLLRFPYIPDLEKEDHIPFNPFSSTPPTPRYYSRSEQEAMNVEDIINLPKREAYIRRPGHELYHLRSLVVDDRGVTSKLFGEVEEEYYRRYFRSQSAIQSDIEATLRALIGDDDAASDDTMGDAEGPDSGDDDVNDGRSDDYDVF